MLRMLQGATLLLGTVTTGMMAGVFLLYAHTIMPGLGKTDDRTFISAFQAIDRAIINPLFLGTFFSGLLFSLLAALLQVRSDDRTVLLFAGAAFVLYAIAFVVTVRVHVPLNDAIKAAGDASGIQDLAGVRQRFDEGRWAQFNYVRAVTSLAACACLAWALVEFGRTGSAGAS